jgi:hypothetical protein
MRYFTAIILAVLLLSLPSCKYFKEKKLFNKKDDVMAEWLAKQDSVRVADSIRQVQEQLLALEAARLDSIRVAEEAREALATQYNIIVGSFVTTEYAIAWAEEFRSRGYDAKIIRPENTRFELVSAESHPNPGRAVTRLEQFRDTVLIDAWIYRKR